MPIYNSSNEIKTINYGSTPVDAVHVGSTKVFPTEVVPTVRHTLNPGNSISLPVSGGTTIRWEPVISYFEENDYGTYDLVLSGVCANAMGGSTTKTVTLTSIEFYPSMSPTYSSGSNTIATLLNHASNLISGITLSLSDGGTNANVSVDIYY